MSHAVNVHDGSGIIAANELGHVLVAFGTSVPADGVVGFAKGCIYIKTSGSANAILFVNAGSSTSADFNALPNAGVGAGAALTAAKPAFTIADAEGTPDEAIQAVVNSNAYGFVTAAEAITFLYKVQNLHVRVGEIEARLEAAGIITAN